MTAIEATPRLAALARAHAALPIDVMTFDQIAWRDHFDGIWACGTLLPVPRPTCLGPCGAWFMSFKYGSSAQAANGRQVTDLDEAGAAILLGEVRGLPLVSMEVEDDGRADHAGERWLSLFCRRRAARALQGASLISGSARP